MSLGLGLGLNRGRTPIIPVDNLPATGFIGVSYWYDKYPHVAALPGTVDYSTRYVLNGTPNVEHRGIKVVTLNGPDTLNIPVIQNMKTDDWEIIATVKDLGATSGGYLATFFRLKKQGGGTYAHMEVTDTNHLVIYFRNDGGALAFALEISAATINEKLFRFSIKKVGAAYTLTLYMNGATYSQSTTNSSWQGDDIVSSYFSDETADIRPLQVGDIRQYVNGELLDYIPCADGTGTVVANYGRADRPDATLSDPTAWGGIWFPQETISKTSWKYNGFVWARSYPYPFAFADLDFTDPSLPGWERQYTDADNFSIEDVAGQSFTKAAKFTLTGGELWTNPETGGTSARSEIQLKNTANHGSTYEYEWWLKIDSTYVESADWQIITQWHDQPDPSIEEGWTNFPAHSPPVSLQYKQGSIYVAVVDNFTTGHVTLLLAKAISKNVWHKVKFKIRWSIGADGTVEAWLDDVPLDYLGQTKYTARNSFTQAGNYAKWGLYINTAITTKCCIHIANIQSRLV